MMPKLCKQIILAMKARKEAKAGQRLGTPKSALEGMTLPG